MARLSHQLSGAACHRSCTCSNSASAFGEMVVAVVDVAGADESSVAVVGEAVG